MPMVNSPDTGLTSVRMVRTGDKSSGVNETCLAGSLSDKDVKSQPDVQSSGHSKSIKAKRPIADATPPQEEVDALILEGCGVLLKVSENLQIRSFGVIIYDNDAFHTHNQLWPVGFKAEYFEDENGIWYECKIEGGNEENGPLFAITAHFAEKALIDRQHPPRGSCTHSVSEKSASRAWRAVLLWILRCGNPSQRNAAERDLQLGDLDLEKRFAFHDDKVRKLLEGLKNSRRCEGYRFMQDACEQANEILMPSAAHRSSRSAKRLKFRWDDRNIRISYACSEVALQEMYREEGPLSCPRSSVNWKVGDCPVSHGRCRIQTSCTLTAEVDLKSENHTIARQSHKEAIANLLYIRNEDERYGKLKWKHVIDTGRLNCQVPITTAGECCLRIEVEGFSKIGEALTVFVLPLMNLGFRGGKCSSVLECGKPLNLELRVPNSVDCTKYSRKIYQSLIEEPPSITLDGGAVSISSISYEESYGVVLLDVSCENATDQGQHELLCRIQYPPSFKNFDEDSIKFPFEVISTPTTVIFDEDSINDLVAGTRDWSIMIELKNDSGFDAPCTVQRAALIKMSDVSSSNAVLLNPNTQEEQLNSHFQLQLCDRFPSTFRGSYFLELCVQWTQEGRQESNTILCQNREFKVSKPQDPRLWNGNDVVDYLLERGVGNSGLTLCIANHQTGEEYSGGVLAMGDSWMLVLRPTKHANSMTSEPEYPWASFSEELWLDWSSNIELKYISRQFKDESDESHLRCNFSLLSERGKGWCLCDSASAQQFGIGTHKLWCTIPCHKGSPVELCSVEFEVLMFPDSAIPFDVTAVEDLAQEDFEQEVTKGCELKVNAGTKTWQMSVGLINSKLGVKASCEEITARFIDSCGAKLEPLNLYITTKCRPGGFDVYYRLNLCDQVPDAVRGKFELELAVWKGGIMKSIRCKTILLEVIYPADPDLWTTQDVITFVRSMGIDTEFDCFQVRDETGAIKDVDGKHFVEQYRYDLRDWLGWTNGPLDSVQKKKLDTLSKELRRICDIAKCMKGEYSRFYGHCLLEGEFERTPVSVGEGLTAVVYKARWVRKSKDVALKIFKWQIGKGFSQILETIRAEIKLMQRFRSCRHVVLCYNMMMGETTAGIVLECADTDLAKLIESWKGKDSEWSSDVWKECISRALGAARGIYFLHQFGVVHQDVKSSNILICGPCTKIADLGQCKLIECVLSHPMTQSSFSHTTNHNTWQFSSPEALSTDRAKYIPKELKNRTDSWSFGAVLFHLATRRVPFDTKSRDDYNASQTTKSLDEILELDAVKAPTCPPVLTEVCKGCSMLNPSQRFSFDTIVEKLADALRPTRKAEIIFGFFAQDKSDLIDVYSEAQEIMMNTVKEKGFPFDFKAFVKPTFASFREVMKQANGVVSLLFSGHGEEQQGFIFSGSDSRQVDYHEVASVIRENCASVGTIGCVVLNACNMLDFGKALVDVGVTYVVAWQGDVNDLKARDFSVWFYKSLADTFPRDYRQAFHDARGQVEQAYRNHKGRPILLQAQQLLIEKTAPDQMLDGDNDVDDLDEVLRSWAQPRDEQHFCALAGVEERNALRALDYPMTLHGKEIGEGNGVADGRLNKEALAAMKVPDGFLQLWGSKGRVIEIALSLQGTDTAERISNCICALQKAVDYRDKSQQRFTCCPKGPAAFKPSNGQKGCLCDYCKHAYMSHLMIDCSLALKGHLRTLIQVQRQ